MGHIRDHLSRFGQSKDFKIVDFESLSMKDIDSVDSFYTRVVGLINQLKSHGETIEYQRVVEKILRSLPPRFESLVVTLEEHTDMPVFTIDDL